MYHHFHGSRPDGLGGSLTEQDLNETQPGRRRDLEQSAKRAGLASTLHTGGFERPPHSQSGEERVWWG